MAQQLQISSMDMTTPYSNVESGTMITEYTPQMVDILQEGLMLKFNIQNLKKDFQNIIDGVEGGNNKETHKPENSKSPKMAATALNSAKSGYGTPQIKKSRKDIVLVSRDFNDDRIGSNPAGIIVSDTPLSQQNVRTPVVNSPSKQRIGRSVYKSHKKRLMARRESGDGAPAECLPKKHQRRSSGYSHLGSIVSPMRRLPIKDQLNDGVSPFKTFTPVSKQGKLLVDSDNINYAKEPRPSPEGLVCEPPRHNSCSTLKNNRPDSSKSRYQKSVPMLSPDLYNIHGQVTKGEPHNGVSKTIKRKAAKKNFPKTPKSKKCLPRVLETISEDQLMQIRMYTNYLENLPCNSQLYKFHPSEDNKPKQCENKNTTAFKDISHISNLSRTSFREQPSNANLREHLECSSSFGYPLHSTMSYPLHSTMHNAQIDIDISNVSDDADVSSFIVPQKVETNKEVHISNQSNGQSSSGVSLSDSDKTSSPEEPKTLKNTNKFVSLSSAEGINMDKFSCDEGIMSDSDSELDEDSFFGQKLPGPVTPSNAVKDYYTLTYTPEQQQEESDCNSSFLSINVDTNNASNTKRQSCHHINNIVTCRCHVHQVHRIRRKFPKVTSKSNFIESALFIDSQEADPMETDQNSYLSSKNTQRSLLKYSQYKNNTKGSHRSTQNRFNADSILALDSSSHMDTDMKPHVCNSIESITTVERLSVPLHPIKSSKKSRDIVKATHVDSNCLNLGKLLKTKDNSQDLIEATIVNQTLRNPNVTMVAQGCLGFLKKKNKGTTKSSRDKNSTKKSAKPCKYEEFEDDDKENAGSSRKALSFSKGVSCDIKSSSNEQSVCSSFVSGIDKDTKRKLSRRMKDFRETTFSDPRKMQFQTMGHI